MASEPRRESSPRLSDDQAAELGGRIVRALLRENGGWARALRAARTEGLGALVSLAFEKGTVSVPCDVAASFGKTKRLQRLAAIAVQEGALMVLRELDEAGVAYAAIKGFAIAPRYGRPHLRRIADVDLVTRPGDLARAEGILLRRGYRVAKRDAIEVSFEPPPSGELLPPFDVHVRLSYEGQFDLDTTELLERAVPWPIGAGSIPVLAAEDAVLVACCDAARDCFILAGRAITDIAVLAMTSSPVGSTTLSGRRGVDWDAVVERARRYGLSAAAWIALSCARRTLVFGARTVGTSGRPDDAARTVGTSGRPDDAGEAPVPARAARRLVPSALRAAYLRLWLDPGRLSPWRLTRRAARRSDLRFAMAVLWPALVDGFWRRAAFVTRYGARRAASKLRSWLALLMPTTHERTA